MQPPSSREYIYPYVYGLRVPSYSANFVDSFVGESIDDCHAASNPQWYLLGNGATGLLFLLH
uniref:Uncharacterized protein n=1 Tax=Arundo donax TaxID=35708 RepID=A0A0A9HQR7_ARUDO